MVNSLNESMHAGEFIISEAPGYQSRERVTVKSGQNLKAGHVIAMATGIKTATTAFSGTGTGTITMDSTAPVKSTAKVGAYTVTCVAVATNGGRFQVDDPDGNVLEANLLVGATFDDDIKFVLNDGTVTDYAVGDRYTITVALAGKVAATSFSGAGDGTITMDATTPVNQSTAYFGTYRAVLTSVATNGGTFTVYDPLGNSLGTVAVGATFNTQIKFVIADGSTDFADGDAFSIVVSQDLGKVVELAPSAADGTQEAYGILFDKVDASTTATAGVAIRRNAEVQDAMLTWPTSITTAQKNIAKAQLEARGVLVR